MAFLNFLIFSITLTLSLTEANKWNHDEEGVDKYVTRPDIVSPRWQINYHDKDRSKIAPGYWFVAPYEKIGERQPGGAWIGPHIYDGEGQLVWSGSHMFQDRNIMDFKLSDVRGEKKLTMMLPPEEDGLILDNSYQIEEKVPVGIKGSTLNMHEFNFVENGDTLLLLKRDTHGQASVAESKRIGFDGECGVSYAGFEELDTTTWETRFAWSSRDWIPLEESTLDTNPPRERCTGAGWDYLHSNALDKFDDGHYLFSARHADTVYKIDKDDGHIHWRLSGRVGRYSDFEMNDLNFTRQHHTRFRSQNETHTIISLFDNTKGQDARKASSNWSRALLIALRTDVKPMQAEIIQAFDHPYRETAYRRGDYQVLGNGNAFICWSEHSLQSEHSPDGTLLWDAQMEPRWIGTYRATKHEFVGMPVDPPDVHSEAFWHDDLRNPTSTTVHVSWNGATEVSKWNLYKSDMDGNSRVRLASTPRMGFETLIEHNGYAAFVIVEGIDKHGASLGESKVIRTIPSDNMSTTAVEAELQWLDEIQSPAQMIAHQAKHAVSNPIATFFAGAIACMVAMFVISFVRRRRAASWMQKGRYAQVEGDDEAAHYDETKLADLSSSEGSQSARHSLGEDDQSDEDVPASKRTPFVRQVSTAV